MKLPPKNSTLGKYVWEKISDNIGLLSAGPIAFIPQSNSMYYNDVDRGTIHLWDLDKNNITQLVGVKIGSEANQLAQNRYLDTPRHVEAISDNEIVFSDHFNLQRSQKNAAKDWEISTIISNFPRYKFRISGDNLIQSKLNSLAIYSLTSGKVISSATNGINTLYEIQQGMSNNLQNIKTISLHSHMDLNTINKGYFSLGEFVVNGITIASKKYTPLINIFTYNSLQCGTGGAEACLQAPVQKNADNADFVNGSDYRLNQSSGGYYWHTYIGSSAFDSSDRYVFTCLNDGFKLYDTLDKKIYPFSAKTTSIPAKNISCSTANSNFVFYKGLIYFNHNRVFYKMVKDNILKSNAAEFEELVFPTPLFPASGNYFGFSLSDNYIYYTDKITGRVFRNKR